MFGVIQFIKSVLKFAIFLALTGNLIDVTHVLLNSSAKAHQHRGISFKKMNQMLVGK